MFQISGLLSIYDFINPLSRKGHVFLKSILSFVRSNRRFSPEIRNKCSTNSHKNHITMRIIRLARSLHKEKGREDVTKKCNRLQFSSTTKGEIRC